MKTLVIFPGRFQPAHLGHLSVYDYLAKKFGENAVYVATSDVQAPATSPFSFADKVEMWTKMGVPASHVVKVKSPYNPVEITKEVPDPEETALVIAISEKDMMGDSARFRFGTKKDGTPSFMQPFPGEAADLAPMTEHAYVLTIPTTTFKVSGADANSATQIRQSYLAGNADDRRKILHDLYGDSGDQLKPAFDRRMAAAADTASVVKEARELARQNQRQRHRVAKLLETVLQKERQAEGSFFKEDLIQTHFKER